MEASYDSLIKIDTMVASIGPGDAYLAPSPFRFWGAGGAGREGFSLVPYSFNVDGC
jgi:hypothetical protein